ncbi:hypothetical protein EHS25_008780 [Saitozyma podzolica]|uniref:Uncharacterized protein n=1 Tax=Saitozyma podzolica TaxID=1890683 RepID=A0A427YMQ1_9TREE|nr:hypothetical protein EHS25_008780 [Saitozyma podzolica]
MSTAKPIHPSVTAPRYSLGGHRNILDLIASYVAADATLSSYMRVSWECYDVVGPKLYHHVECSEQRTLKAIVRGVEVGALMASPCNAPKLTVWADLVVVSYWRSGDNFMENRRQAKYSRAWGSTVNKVVLKNLSSLWTNLTAWIISSERILPPADSVALVLPTSTISLEGNEVCKLSTWSHAYTELSIILDSENTTPPERPVFDDGRGWVRQTCDFLIHFSLARCPGTINVYFMDDFIPAGGDGTSWSPSRCRDAIERKYRWTAPRLLGNGKRPTFNFRTRKDYLDAGVTDEYTAEGVAILKRAEGRSLERAEALDTVV